MTSLNPLTARSLPAYARAWIDCVPHYPTLIDLARGAETVIELGVRGGVSTWALLRGLPKSGLMWSVDIIDCVVPPKVSSDPRWTLLVGDDLDPAIQAQLPQHADLIFIDTSHTYKQTMRELAYYSTLTNKMALHDYALDDVRLAVSEFCVAQGWRITRNEVSQWGFVVLEP